MLREADLDQFKLGDGGRQPFGELRHIFDGHARRVRHFLRRRGTAGEVLNRATHLVRRRGLGDRRAGDGLCQL